MRHSHATVDNNLLTALLPAITSWQYSSSRHMIALTKGWVCSLVSKPVMRPVCAFLPSADSELNSQFQLHLAGRKSPQKYFVFCRNQQQSKQKRHVRPWQEERLYHECFPWLGPSKPTSEMHLKKQTRKNLKFISSTSHWATPFFSRLPTDPSKIQWC